MKPVYQDLAQRLRKLDTDADKFSEALEELRLHSAILDTMAEGIYLVSAENGKILYANPRFERMFGYGSGSMVGRHVSIVNASTEKNPEATAMEIMDVLDRTGHWSGEVHNVKKDGTTFWCYANVSVLDHHRYGRVFISVHTDITARKAVEEERERLVRELQQALVSVKTLRGLIPICALCKKVRDDRGYWRQVEAYVREHTGADFSHTYCPVCYAKTMREVRKVGKTGAGKEKPLRRGRGSRR